MQWPALMGHHARCWGRRGDRHGTAGPWETRAVVELENRRAAAGSTQAQVPVCCSVSSHIVAPALALTILHLTSKTTTFNLFSYFFRYLSPDPQVMSLYYLLWVELCPHHCTPEIHMLKPYPLVPQNVTLSGDRVFKKVTRIKWSH